MSLSNLWFLLRAGLLVYLGLGLALFLFQSHLIFFPDMPSRALSVTPERAGLAYESVEIVAEDGVRLHGWWLPAGPEARAVLLFFHGNAGNISHRLASLKIFADLGLDVLIVDYRGYGRSEGEVSEEGTYLDAEAAWRHLVDGLGVPPERIVLFGRSLGAAVAAQLASRHRPGALILESGFTSVPDLAQQLYPIYPAHLLARYRYATKEYLEMVRSPVLIVHSQNDEIIPFEHGRALFAAVPGPKTFLELRGGHNDGFLVSRRTYVEGLDGFLTRHFGGSSSEVTP